MNEIFLMNKAIGIDIGGTNIKAGIIDGEGNFYNLKVFSSHDWISSGDFSGQLEQVIREFNENGIIGCGIAIPGLISYDRKSCFQVTAIPEINNLNVVDRIASVFPDIPVRLENDANAAAYGEYRASGCKEDGSLLLVTMGTGIGAGLIYRNEIFKGGNGNALELGETISRTGKKLEQLIGAAGIVRLAGSLVKDSEPELYLENGGDMSVESIMQRAKAGDHMAGKVLYESGMILGESLVNFVLLFDIVNIAIGGGVSEGFKAISEGIHSVFKERLSSYYLGKLNLYKAILGNKAGMVGAASLFFKQTING